MIEFIIYLAIVGVAVSAFILSSLAIARSRYKSDVVAEVQANTRVALELISQKIHAASALNAASSVFGTDPGVLSLAMQDLTKNPTILDLDQDDGALRIKEGVQVPVLVTSPRVKVTNLVFTNLISGPRENIRIQMTIDYRPTPDIPLSATQTIESAVSLRQ